VAPPKPFSYTGMAPQQQQLQLLSLGSPSVDSYAANIAPIPYHVRFYLVSIPTELLHAMATTQTHATNQNNPHDNKRMKFHACV
jgi:hypothetical protein